MNGAPRAEPMSRARPPAAGHSAFTLVEMMVVILIISILLALGIGAIMRKKATNRLLATEQLIADFVRQARHTARSSGAPVVLKIAPVDANDPTLGWTVSGVSRQCIWSESWDDSSGGSAARPAAASTITVGVNGNGRTNIADGQ